MKHRNVIIAISIVVAMAVAGLVGGSLAIISNSNIVNPVVPVPRITSPYIPGNASAAKTVPVSCSQITFVVNGSPALINYGVDGQLTGHSPMSVCEKLDRNHEAIYNLIVQQQGNGSTSALIKIGSKVIARGTASPYHRTLVLSVYKNSGGEWTGVTSH